MSLRSHTALLSDPAAIRRQFPLLAREGLHYLDSAATAQMPEAVIAALQKFGTSLRANVYGGVYKLAQEALASTRPRAPMLHGFLVRFRHRRSYLPTAPPPR